MKSFLEWPLKRRFIVRRNCRPPTGLSTSLINLRIFEIDLVLNPYYAISDLMIGPIVLAVSIPKPSYIPF